jgi:hypothetical protein
MAAKTSTPADRSRTQVSRRSRAANEEPPNRDAQLPRLVGEIVLDAAAWKHDDPDRQDVEHGVVALERSGLGVLRPVRLEGDLRHLAVVRPLGGDGSIFSSVPSALSPRRSMSALKESRC